MMILQIKKGIFELDHNFIIVSHLQDFKGNYTQYCCSIPGIKFYSSHKKKVLKHFDSWNYCTS